MGSVFATFAFKAYEIMWKVYDKKYGAREKTDRERAQEQIIERQKKLITDAKAYCDHLTEQLRNAKEDAAWLRNKNSELMALLKKHALPVSENPYPSA